MKLGYLLIFFVANMYAIPEPPQPAPGPPGGIPPPEFLIDDHAVILLTIAVIYGLYVVYNKNQQSTI